MENIKEQSINGKHLYYAFIAGGKQVLQNQNELNQINVFPVSDKDTGTNLASTIRSVIDNIKPDKSYKTTLNEIANASLIGARGNSGVIFAQFFYGLNQKTNNSHVITLKELAESVKGAIPYIYEAIANPVEGTILTVIKDWSDFLNSKMDKIYDLKTVMNESNIILEKSLFETTAKLNILNKHNLVDAGAKGFVLFMKGIIALINNMNIRELSTEISENISIVHSDEIFDKNIKYRYCTEAILKNLIIKKEDLKQLLNNDADSVVVAGSESICRIHIHTNEPAELFYKLKDFGTITFQKVDDMIRQLDIATKRKWNIALVTDSTCDLSKELIDFYQINMIPININFGDNHYLDKITMQPNQFYNLLESSDDFPKTSQINEQSFTNIYSHLASHYDAIISIHLTSQFSGTYLSSQKAAKRISNEFNKPIFTFDSKSLSGALGLLVLKTAQSIEAGNSLESIINSLEAWRKNAKIFVSVKDLKYMIKGGRVSKPKGSIANALGLNPVISIDDEGKSLLFGNTFSQNSSLNKVFKHVEKLSQSKSIWNYIILHAHNFDGAKEAEHKMFNISGKEAISIVDISPVIGMHAGKGSIAISLLFNN
ncbi:MAG: DegV family EDD domain-containing protein [Bacteroidetes bacterium]|nr:DegV family EDD domain-containing protein [Bacteroidota bacterium]MBU1115582.1 DegV family EDD domain-containing protein [Bacteroidota bacterium]MBU1797051.1 DegV family EDD domain-containing protein [Bacteroidota bacterium]